jgi:hypothetical protein
VIPDLGFADSPYGVDPSSRWNTSRAWGDNREGRIVLLPLPLAAL